MKKELNNNIKNIIRQFKNFTIPSIENFYKPTGLHPKRLLFYTISSVAIKVLVVVVSLSLPITAWLTPDILAEQSKKIVLLTNEIRSDFEITPLNENILLDDAALYKANDMLDKQYFAHTGPDNKNISDWLQNVDYKYSVAGENLAMGFTSAEDVINAWTRSNTHYANIIDPSYSEIGVGMVSGLYNNQDSTLVVQYFGSERLENVAKNNNVIDHNLSAVSVIKEQNKNIIEANIYFLEPIKEASVNFNNYNIQLKNIDNNKWSGSLSIYNNNGEENIFDPVVLASVKAIDFNNQTIIEDINWASITPIKASLLKQYLFLKNNSTNYTQNLFNFSTIYYKILATILFILLMLNIFIEIKKQHPHIIFSSLGLFSLLFLFIYF